MDQNTNNSFTSAPQGGDFSDIIIPNAYAAKPKGKNLKKYLVFGVVGLLALFLISLIVKTIFVDSRTMSKQEFIQFAESEDMGNIEWFEDLLVTVKNDGIKFNQLFNELRHKNIEKVKGSLLKTKQLIDNKSNINGDSNVKRNYSEFRNGLTQRFKVYNESMQIYEDFYQAYTENNIKILDKYNSKINNISFTPTVKVFTDVILASQNFKVFSDKNNCQNTENNVDYIGECKIQYQLLTNSKTMADVEGISKKIFALIYEQEDYSNKKILREYIDNCLLNMR